MLIYQAISLLLTAGLLLFGAPVFAAVEIDEQNPSFAENVIKELILMREGKRGVVCAELVNRLDQSQSVTTIRPITPDEKTWHPNDRKGTRSHVVPLDTKLRSAARTMPVSAVLYLHPSRIDPQLSLFKLGTFVDELANAVDLNRGTYSGDYRLQTRRSTFFRNAWKDALGGEMVQLADRVQTLDYQKSKKLNLLTEENAGRFPILDPESLTP